MEDFWNSLQDSIQDSYESQEGYFHIQFPIEIHYFISN